MASFTFYKQYDQKNCGPTCVKMVAKHYGRKISIEYLNKKAHVTRDGATVVGLADAADSIGLNNAIVSIPWEMLKEDITFPCIAYWRQRHFVVIYKIVKDIVYVADPAFGKIKYSKEEFFKGWLFNKKQSDEGIIMLLEPSPEFYEKSEDEHEPKSKGFKYLLPYVSPHKKAWVQILIGLLIIALFQLTLPFLTQSIVDVGIRGQNLKFIYVVLFAQLMLIFSQTSIQIIRDWLLLYVTNKININLTSDYLIKLMKLPLSYYDSKNVGDIMQRIQDNGRIQNFVSTTSLNILFSGITFIIFSLILAYYNVLIFVVFLTGAFLYFIWSIYFMKRREEIDYRRFDASSGNQTSIFQLLTGMSEIRINNSERKRRWEWESIQINLFKISMKGLAITQTQNTGGVFINEIKNILITIISASLVINGKITLGMMLAIQYILGQLNVPIASFVSFIQSAQDAKLSIKRLEEVYSQKNEEEDSMLSEFKIGDINIQDLNFRYGDSSNQNILNKINAKIKAGEVTALVGVSGSGKTTLLKLLLKYYPITEGKIKIENQDFNTISPKEWRSKCGVVMQEGFIFSGTIEENIAESEPMGIIDFEKVEYAAKIANISEFIESLPNSYQTGIGRSGMGLSGGQTQRILIARAIYKNPSYLFFDEATSALDTDNEKIIMDNLYKFFENKTVLIIAHRLSTVKNANNILVLDNGEIIESGTHEDLVKLKGKYFNLVRNQLEL